METYNTFLPGTPKEKLDTPALLIDLPVMEANIEKMARFFRDKPAKLRPHFKTVKSPILARKQVEAGAIGICCAKVGEAEVAAEGGIKDIFITNQVIGPAKIARLISLCRLADMKVAADNPQNMKELSDAAIAAGVKVGVLVEVNTGMARCGVEPGRPTVELARAIARSPGLVFKGVMGYEGHCVNIVDYEERVNKTTQSLKLLLDTKAAVEKAGLPVEIVSAGGTGTYMITGAYPGVTEVEAGSYVFMDGAYRKVLHDFECALTVLTTVISRPRKGVAICDLGRKSISNDMGTPTVVYPNGAILVGLSEEHGQLELTGEAEKLKVGDRIEVLPSHGDTTINIHSHYFAMRNGVLEAVWEIAGRGRFR
jgi:D-serine deaminase-like pyridoxal phosphate-dependent protein